MPCAVFFFLLHVSQQITRLSYRFLIAAVFYSFFITFSSLFCCFNFLSSLWIRKKPFDREKVSIARKGRIRKKGCPFYLNDENKLSTEKIFQDKFFIKKIACFVFFASQFVVVVVVVWGSGRHFVLDVGHIVGPLNYSRCDSKHRLPCIITQFYWCHNGTSRL